MKSKFEMTPNQEIKKMFNTFTTFLKITWKKIKPKNNAMK